MRGEETVIFISRGDGLWSSTDPP